MKCLIQALAFGFIASYVRPRHEHVWGLQGSGTGPEGETNLQRLQMDPEGHNTETDSTGLTDGQAEKAVSYILPVSARHF